MAFVKEGNTKPPAVEVAALVRRFGNFASEAIVDPKIRYYASPNIDGLLPFQYHSGCVVLPGRPLARIDDSVALYTSFKEACKQSKKKIQLFTFSADVDFAHRILYTQNAGIIEFGVEQFINPQKMSTNSRSLRDVRELVKAGVSIQEYDRALPNEALEQQIGRLVEAWQGARHGVQAYTTAVLPFALPGAARWWYAEFEGKLVGFVSIIQLQAKNGYLINHIIVSADAPKSSYLASGLTRSALLKLKEEGYSYASFGVEAVPNLGQIEGFAGSTIRAARKWHGYCAKWIPMGNKLEFRQKFGEVLTTPSYLIFDKPKVKFRTLFALYKAFNVSNLFSSLGKMLFGKKSKPKSSKRKPEEEKAEKLEQADFKTDVVPGSLERKPSKRNSLLRISTNKISPVLGPASPTVCSVNSPHSRSATRGNSHSSFSSPRSLFSDDGTSWSGKTDRSAMSSQTNSRQGSQLSNEASTAD